jgi:two-component system, sensor histidine kinase and response regulator
MTPAIAIDGEQALSLYREADTKAPFDLILTDMHMPKMDGFGLIERLQGFSATEATIMMLTSGGQRGDAQRCAELGISAYLLKPVRQAELREAIARVLRRRATEEETPMITRSTLREHFNGSRTLRILLAEDNPINQKLATRLLEKRNHTVIVVGNGKEALAALETDTFDLVLMDMQMPEMDGFEATIKLREEEKASGKHQPVVAMTALAMNGDRERCMSAGMDGYISKPIRPQELDEVLDQYLTQKLDGHSTPDQSSEANDSVDVNQLLERIDDDRALLEELVQLFKSDYPRGLAAVNSAIQAQSANELQLAGHSLKGVLSNLSASKAAALAADLEIQGKSNDLSQSKGTFEQLGREIEKVMSALEALCCSTAQ